MRECEIRLLDRRVNRQPGSENQRYTYRAFGQWGYLLETALLFLTACI